MIDLGINNIHSEEDKADDSIYKWRTPRRDEFWRKIPEWAGVSSAEFGSEDWQERNSITSPEKLQSVLGALVSDGFVADILEGLQRAPMVMRLSPYILSLINWNSPYDDPIRRQFLPVASQKEEDHPLTKFDSTHEQADSPAPGLTHRYYDRVLFLSTDICPVYCRFCTRSYAIGLDTEKVQKLAFSSNRARWNQCFDYIRSNPQIEDVVISGGDVFRLKPAMITEIAEALLKISHVRRLRFATKGLAVLPMKITSNKEWLNALTKASQIGRSLFKEVVIHTHFNTPNEITGFTEDALKVLFERGIPVRNLNVMLRGVNDNEETMTLLCRYLTWLNVRPYYSYMCDMVVGIEDLRFPLAKGVGIEKYVRGSLSGPYTPQFVVDPPGGCGKRTVHSYELYDQESGLSVYSAPSVKAGKLFVYADPLRSLSTEMQRYWMKPQGPEEIIRDLLKRLNAQIEDLE